MVADLRRVTRALLSVSDKTGLIDFARALSAAGVELAVDGGRGRGVGHLAAIAFFV